MAHPTPPRRATLTVTQSLTAAPAAVWSLLAEGTRVERWFPWVAQTIVDDPAQGGARRIVLEDGSSFHEYIVLNDARSLTYQYYAPAPPLPIGHVIGTQRIELEPGGHAALSWYVTFDVLPAAPPNIVETMAELYRGALLRIDGAATSR
jgi:uncharacterized protein YndB with AHSA1/START domain